MTRLLQLLCLILQILYWILRIFRWIKSTPRKGTKKIFNLMPFDIIP